jgi:4-amino-4-deoxy-L-arabinose transferase-like glycosyltransferase
LKLPSPAIVADAAVRRLPRAALWLFCIAYVLAGFVGRGPWKSADATAFGTMQELVLGLSDWLEPQAAAQHGGYDSLLPFWLGAGAMHLLPFLPADLASRLPFMALLALTLAGTWYAVYHLARSPQAQPVAFAFGGEANPRDYARALADAALLALLACLGLAQLAHETTPALAQLGFTALLFYALAAGPQQHGMRNAAVAALALVGLALSGAPNVALLFGLGAGLIELWDRRHSARGWTLFGWSVLLIALATASVLLAWLLGLWHWRVDTAQWGQAAAQKSLVNLLRLFVWFMWPAWPLALWTLWQWRRQLGSRHVALPLWFLTVVCVSTLLTTASDRGLLLALPALACLAAFALPTLKRSVAALIDWFTLLFFSVCGLTIWVIWIALQTGVPQKPAANVARLAPGFEASFSLLALIVAVLASLAWAWLVKWRTGRHRSALWKSLVLPAGGATLCWVLLMSLWLPLLDHARGYQALVRQVARHVDRQACVETLGLSTAQSAALRYHADLQLRVAQLQPQCPALVVDRQAQARLRSQLDPSLWTLVAAARRPTEKSDDLLIYRRSPRE